MKKIAKKIDKIELVGSGILFFMSIFFMAGCKGLFHTGGLGVELTLGAAFLPMWLSIIMIILSILLFLKSILIGDTRTEPRLVFPVGKGLKRNLAIFIGLLGYILLFESIGFLMATFLFLCFAMLSLEKTRYVSAILMSITVTCGLYILFQLILNIDLPSGILDY